MNLPEVTPSNQRAIDELTKYSKEMLDPMPHFKRYAQRFGKSLADDPKYMQPLYLDFEDYDYLHDTSRLKPIYLNDFDFNLEDDRETLARLTRMEFKTSGGGGSFDTVAVCSESCGKLRGNYLIGSGRVCPDCGNEVELFLDRGEDINLWIKKPEGVKAFINIGFFSTFFNNIAIGSPKVYIPRYFIDPTYRQQVNKQRNVTNVVIANMLEELQIKEVNLNSFYDHCDEIMQWILIGNGKRYFSKANQEGPMLLDFYIRHKHVAFQNYIGVPSRYSTVLEKSGKEIYAYEHQPVTSQLYFAIADTLKSNSVHQLSEKDLKKNVEIVGKNLVKLADQYRKVNNPKTLFLKPAIIRKHVCSGALPFTGRSVISSRTGILNTDELLIPWKMALSMLEIHIHSHLYRKGFTPNKVKAKINQAAYHIDPEIDAFFADMEKNYKCLVQSGRNPSIEYLSLRTFWLRINRDLEDESIKLPILACGPMNACVQARWARKSH